jgi:glucose/arabinose dehydrogenase
MPIITRKHFVKFTIDDDHKGNRIMNAMVNCVRALLLGLSVAASNVIAEVDFKPVFTSLELNQPVLMVSAFDDSQRLFVVEQGGYIKVFQTKDAQPRGDVFLDVNEATNNRFLKGGEQGLLGLAFDPKFQSNGFFYVNYTASSPRRTVISRFMVNSSNPNQADPKSEKVLIEIPQDYANHNGGMIAFGPDGHLYIGMGDGGSGGDPKNRAQDGLSLLGKMLRIDRNGQVPKDNPFVGNDDVRDEIWAIGLRNPWRFSFDRQTGTLWAADVGQNAVEEINIIAEGENYGWRWYEGSQNYTRDQPPKDQDFIEPVFEYGHSKGRSVTGGYVYRGTEFPALQGQYFFGDFVTGKMWSLSSDTFKATVLPQLANPSGFGEDQNGELYVLSYGGNVYQIVDR